MSEPTSAFTKGFVEWVDGGNLMKAKPELLPLSICSIPLEMHYKEIELAKGTGFFWRIADGVALITAWHNLSGLHHTRRTCLHSMGAVPDRLTGRYMARSPQIFQDLDIPLYVDDEMDQPRWTVHRKCGNYFDIAAIQMSITGTEVACVNDYCKSTTEHVLAGSDVFAIGFPLGISSFGVLPIWKRGSLASDIDLPTDGHPKFLVDLPGRSGLSGAPVYRSSRGLIVEDKGNGNRTIGFGNKDEFLGIYTGRAASQDGSDRDSTDLGYIWRASLIFDLLGDPVIDEKPEIGKGTFTTKPIWGQSGLESI